MLGRFNIVISRQCHIARHRSSRALQFAEHSDRHCIIEAENRIWHGQFRVQEFSRRANSAGQRE